MEVKTQDKDTRDDSNVPDTDKGWAWVVAAAGMVSLILYAVTFRTLGILMVELMDVYDTSTAEVSLILTFLGVGFCFTAVLFMLGLGDVFHERALLLFGGLLSSTGYIVTYFSNKVQDVYLLGFFIGASLQIGMACSLSMAGKYFKKKLAIGNGIVMAGSSVGVLGFPPLVSWLYQGYTYRGAALIMAGIMLNMLVTAALMKPKRGLPEQDNKTSSKTDSNSVKPVSRIPLGTAHNGQTDRRSTGYTNPSFTTSPASCGDMQQAMSRNTGGNENQCADKGSIAKRLNISFISVKKFLVKDTNIRSKGNSLKSLLISFKYFKSLAFIFYLLFTYFSTTGTEALLSFYPAFTRDLGMSSYQSAFLLSLVGGADIFARIVFGLLADCNIMRRYKLVLVHQYIICCACFLSRFATEFWSQAVFAIVVGLFYGTAVSFRAVLLIDLFGLTTLLRRLGITNFVHGLAFVSFGPPLGYIRDATGTYDLPLKVIGAMFFASGTSLLATGMTTFCQERRKGRQTTHL